jgi:opacity protein-like surface antigen
VKYLATPLLALALALSAATSAVAQPRASDWKELSGNLTFDGAWHMFDINRETRELRVSSWPHDSSQERHRASYQISPELLSQLQAAVARSTPDTRPYALLRQGAHGTKVKSLQEALSRSGFPVEIDRKFGAETLAALNSYQRKHGLEVRSLLHRESAEHLGLRGPLGDITVNGQEGWRIHSGQLSSVIVSLLQIAKHQAEPKRTQLSGRIVKSGGGLELVTEPGAPGESKRYALRGVHPKLDQAARVIGGKVTLEAQVWEGQGREPGFALFREIKTRVTSEQEPVGVEAGEWVKVAGVTPPRTTRNAAGKLEVVGGNAAYVVTSDGARGYLRKPEWRAPREKKSGISSSLRGSDPR